MFFDKYRSGHSRRFGGAGGKSWPVRHTAGRGALNQAATGATALASVDTQGARRKELYGNCTHKVEDRESASSLVEGKGRKRRAKDSFCRSASMLAAMLWPLGPGLAGQRVPAHSLAGCVGHRPRFARLGLRSSSAARGGWERGPSG